MRENKERFWLRAGHEKAHPRVFIYLFFLLGIAD